MTAGRWSLNAEGSTRAVGLLRICLALILWARYGREMGLHNGFEWWTLPVSILFFASTAAMCVGLWSRAATAVTGLLLIYFYFGLGVTGIRYLFYGHHAYILMAATCLLALTQCGRSYSLDRYLALRRGVATPETGPLWAQNLIVLQMVALYFWTAVDKTSPEFLSGERLEAIFVWGHTNRPAEVILSLPGFAMLAAIIVVVVEYFLAGAIMIRRLAWIAIPTGLALHAGFYVILPVSTYSVTMMALYLAVIHPDALHRFLDQIQGAGAR